MPKYTLYPPLSISASIVANDGFATVTLAPGVSETSYPIVSFGSASMFDDNHTDGTSDHFKLVDVNSSDEIFTVEFNPRIESIGGKIKLVIVTRLNDTYSVRLNDDSNLDSGTLIGNNGNYTYTNTVIFGTTYLEKITFTMGDASQGTGTYHEIQEIYIYTVDTIIPDPDFEFNDSVLSTKAWNSSRYDGRQLQGAVVNEFRAGDTTYGKTPVLRNYTRNIYVGSDIINVSSSVDDTLMEIPDFCYITINKSLTINDDNSITENIIESKDNNFDLKNGWYRSFFDDFKQGSDCKVLINNTKTRTNLKEKYKIYFNGGQLQKICEFNDDFTGGSFPTEYIISYFTGSNEQYINVKHTAGIGYYSIKFYNEDIYNKFFSGKVNPNNYLDGASGGTTALSDGYEPFPEFFSYKNDSSYKADKRFFATFFNADTGYPIRTLGSGSIPAGSTEFLQSNNLAELSTIEIISASRDGSSYIRLHTTGKLNQLYSTNPYPPQDYTYATALPIVADQGPVMITKTEDTIPSLLLNIPYNQTFPNGIENTDFVVIPENLHPYIKDNLAYFLTRAGIDVGGNTSTIIPLNQTKRYPDRIGWKPPKPAPTPELQEAQDAKTEITFEQRRLLNRQLAEQNRRRRLERLREEEENQRRNKRQSKREDRQEERKERKKRREERKENRRENRQERREDRRENRQNRRENRRNRRRNR